MKRICVLILALASLPVMACDICGAGAGGSYLGLLPQFHKRFFGFRYQQNSILHHLGPGGSYSYLTTRETYRVAECWGATNLGSGFRITGFIPVNFIERNNAEEHLTDHGVGDITVIGYYRLLNREPGEHSSISGSLWLGAGIKLPAGKYNPDDRNVQQASQNTFQLGTGSTDYSFHLMYDLKVRRTGINVNAGYKVNTANRYGYRYGNKLTVNTLLYQQIRLSDRLVLTPNAGVMFEDAGKDQKVKDLEVWETGGHSCMGTLGLECAFGRVSAGLNYQSPLAQQLGEGKLRAGDRGMIHLGFSF